MTSRVDLLNNANISTVSYATQKTEGRGKQNLFVGGNIAENIVNDTDEAVILVGSGDSTVTSTGTNNRLESNGGDSTFNVKGNENTVKTIDGEGTVVSDGDSNTIVTKNGKHTILALGNKTKVDAGEGGGSVVFDGNDVDITADGGFNYIASLDFAIGDKNYEGYIDRIHDKTIKTTDYGAFVSKVDDTREVSRNKTGPAVITGEEILKQLPANEQQLLKSINLNEQINGQAKYVIAKGSQDGVYHIYQYSGTNTYRAIGGVANGNVILTATAADLKHIDENTEKTTQETVVTQDYTRTTYADLTKETIEGNKNVKVTIKNGDSLVKINGETDFTKGNGSTVAKLVNGIEAITGYTNEKIRDTDKGDAKTTITPTVVKETVSMTLAVGNARTYDPLIIDFNQDGKVSAENGKGIDLNGDKIADGAATGGDKMLAMSDINGNGSIDGQEVFGDKTVDPFTGKQLNAANGFEALKLVAQSAQANTNIKCIDENGLVDLKALNKALETKGIKLGFVSEENNKEIEELSKVAYINTKDYISNQETGSVQHNQTGTSIFEDGSSAKVDDVWFESTVQNNPFDFTKLKNLMNE